MDGESSQRPAGSGRGLDLLVRLVALIPYGLAAFWPSLTPTRALALAALIEAGRPGPNIRRLDLEFFARHASLWLLLHSLRPDATWLLGAGFLVASTVSRRWWARPGAENGRFGFAALLLLPALLGFFLELNQRDRPEALSAVNFWDWAAPITSEPEPDRVAPELPAGGEYFDAGITLPDRLEPYPLEDSPQRARALVLLLILVGWQVGGLLLRHARRVIFMGLAVPAVLVVTRTLGEPAGVPVYFQLGMEPESRRLLEVHAAGSHLWDPLRGSMLPPRGSFVVREEEKSEFGLFRVVSAFPWAVVRPWPSELDPTEVEPLAWLELHPLRAPRSGGPAPDHLGILWHWAAADQLRVGGVRWELSPLEDGWFLHRRPLP